MSKEYMIKFDQKTVSAMDRMKASCGLSSDAEVIRRALALLSIAEDARHGGKKLVIKDGDSETEIDLG